MVEGDGARHDREIANGALRWMTADEIAAWRKGKPARLNNRDGRRVISEDSFSIEEDVPGALLRSDTHAPVVEAPPATQPADPRGVVERLAAVYAEQVLVLKRTDPEGFRQKLEDLRAASPSWYAHLTDVQLEDALLEVCRKAVAEATVQREYERMGRGGGFRDTVLLP